ncbi:MAG: hypothetical protein AAGD10_15105 [Myxococcota bacterium]
MSAVASKERARGEFEDPLLRTSRQLSSIDRASVIAEGLFHD